MLSPSREYTANQLLLLKLLRHERRVTRSALAELSGLSPLTVTKTATRFLADGVARELGHESSTGGRKAAALGLNSAFGYALAVDIGAHSVKIGVVNLSGEVLERRYLFSQEPEVIPSFIISPEDLSVLLKELMLSHGEDKCIGVGFGISGVINRGRTAALFCPNVAGWNGFDLVSMFEKRLSVPVFLDTSARCMALGERYYGAARNEPDFVFVSIGYSVAAGIFTQGKLFRGGSGSAGELGHTLVRDGAELCTCGNRGCLELFVTVPMVLSRIYSLPGSKGSGDAEAAPKSVCDGDEAVCRELREIGHILGIALANMANLLNPNMIILGGGLIEAFPLVADEAASSVLSRCLPFAGKGLCVKPTALGKDCSIIGCASQALNGFFGQK